MTSPDYRTIETKDITKVQPHKTARPRAVSAAVWAAPWILATLTTALYTAVSVRRYVSFTVTTWDLGIFTQAVAGYSHLAAPISQIKGPGFDILGDHFSPIDALVALPYRVWPTPITLLVTQSALIGVSVLPVTRLAMARLGWLAGLLIGVCYAVSYGLQQAVFSEFHEVCFAVALLAFALEAFVDRRWRRCVAYALPLLLVKEDLGVTVAVLGVLIAVQGPRRLGIGTAAVGLAGSMLAMFVIIPWFNPSGHYDYLNQLGGSSTVAFAWSQPWALFTPEPKPETIAIFLAVTAAVALRSPVVLLALPTFLWRFLSTEPAHWGTNWHYDAVLMPIAFIALIDGAVRMRRSPRRGWVWPSHLAVPAVVIASILILPHRPLATITEPVDPQRVSAAETALAHIPTGATVETDLGLLSHLVSDRRVSWLAAPGDKAPDYLVVDAATGWGPPDARDMPKYAEQRYPGTRYTLVWSDGTITIVGLSGASDRKPG